MSRYLKNSFSKISHYRCSFLLLFLALPHFLISQDLGTDLEINYVAKNVSLQKIFHDLESEYNVRFSYSTNSILQYEMDCVFEKANLDEVLDFLIADKWLEYKLVGNNILLRKKEGFQEENNSSYQKSIHLQGKVVLSDTDKELEYVTVALGNSSIGTYTDEQGRFDIVIPAQYLKDSLVFHSMGFIDKTYRIADLQNEFMIIALNTGSFDMEEVVVVNNRKRIKILNNSNGISLDLKDDLKSGMMNDGVAKQLQKLAGISAQDDKSSAIKIRGSQGDETLVILDDMPLYNCSHYYGIFSSLNSSFLEELTLFKSYFPLHYGGKTGGVVELKSSEELIDQNNGNVEIDLMSTGGLIRLKLSDKLNLFVAGRGTIRDISNSQFNSFSSDDEQSIELVQSFSEPVDNFTSTPSFRFFDLNAKLLWKPTVNQTLSISAFSSEDQLENSFEAEIKEPNSNKKLKIEGRENESWGNLSLGLQHLVKLPKQFEIKTSAYYTNYFNSGMVSYEIKKPPSMDGDPDPDKFEVGILQENDIKDIGLKSYLSKSYHKLKFEFGLEYIFHDIIYDLKENKEGKLKGEEQLNDISVFGGLELKPFSNFTIKAGLRGTYFEGTQDYYLSPRVLVNYNLHKSFNLKSSFGIYQQFIREFPFEYRGEPRKLWVSAGSNKIPVLSSQNIMFGFNGFVGQVGFDVELYRKDFDHLIEFSIVQPGMGNESNMPGPRNYDLFKGDGYTHGLDLSIHTGFKGFDTYITYTLSKTEERYKAIIMNRYYAAEDDRRHQVKWVNQINWKNWLGGIDWIFISGRPYTDVKKLGGSGDIRDAEPSNRFSKVEPYSRLDLSLGYIFEIGKIDSRISISILNLLDTKNYKYIQNVSESVNHNSEPINIVIGNESELLNRTFNLSWRISFGSN